MDMNRLHSAERHNAAAAETLLLREISRRQLQGYKFKRQVCSEPFVVEFVCHELKLVVELCGEKALSAVQSTSIRTQQLESKGFQVARFGHQDVLTNLTGVIESLTVAVRQCKKALSMSRLACRYLSGGLGKVTSRPIYKSA